MDESTDRGVTKREGTLIRYYDESTLTVATGFMGGGGGSHLQDVATCILAETMHIEYVLVSV